MNLIVKNLKHALELLGPNGENWIKGNYNEGKLGSEPSKFCTIGCLSHTLNTKPWHMDYREEFQYVRKALASLGLKTQEELEEYNDAPLTTFNDIKKLFTDAMVLASLEPSNT